MNTLPLGAVDARRPPPPHDARLPQLAALLAPDAVRPLLAGSLPARADELDVAIEGVAYDPGRSATVRYRVRHEGAERSAAASAGAGVPHCAGPAVARLARRAGRRADVAQALVSAPRLGALFQWYPLDLRLPHLCEGGARLRRRLLEAGLAPGEPSDPQELMHLPGRRAAIRLGDHVLKLFADEAELAQAKAAQRSLPQSAIPTAPLLTVLEGARAAVYPAIDGDRLFRADAGPLAPAAGELLRVLHALPVSGGVPVAPAGRQLAETAAAGRLVARLVPALAPRVATLLARLEHGLPDREPLVTSHADFNVSQILRTADGPVVLDFDGLCAAPRALDVASFAANVLGGRDGDLDAAREVLESIVAAYGRRPRGLGWYTAALCLRRAPSPFRLWKKRWPKRVEAMVASAERALVW